MIKYIIIGISVFIVLLIIIIVVVNGKKKEKWQNKKVEIAKKNINLYLEEKEELIKKTKNYIKNKSYQEQFIDEDFKCNDEFEKYEMLGNYEEKFNAEIFENGELEQDKDIIKLKKDIRDNNSNLKGAILYYNDSIDKYEKNKKYKKFELKKD